MKKFMTIMSLMLAFSMMTSACYHPKRVPVDAKIYEIIFDFGNIDSVVFYEDNNVMLLHYDDPDAFDLDNLAFITGRDEWYGEYVGVTVNDTLITEFINDYHKYLSNKNWEYRENLNYGYILIEKHIRYDNGDIDVVFYIKTRDEYDE